VERQHSIPASSTKIAMTNLVRLVIFYFNQQKQNDDKEVKYKNPIE
jgi:hypothetical protein